MKHMTSATLLFFALSLPAAADHHEPATDLRTAFSEADGDGNGHIDREEFHLRVVELFFHADLDKNGFVTPKEIDEVTLFHENIEATDRNGDGRISLHEFVERRFRMFRAGDSDQDGRLTFEEVSAAYQKNQEP